MFFPHGSTMMATSWKNKREQHHWDRFRTTQTPLESKARPKRCRGLAGNDSSAMPRIWSFWCAMPPTTGQGVHVQAPRRGKRGACAHLVLQCSMKDSASSGSDWQCTVRTFAVSLEMQSRSSNMTCEAALGNPTFNARQHESAESLPICPSRRRTRPCTFKFEQQPRDASPRQ